MDPRILSRFFRPNEEHATTGLDQGFILAHCLTRFGPLPRSPHRLPRRPPPRHRHRTSGGNLLETAHRAAPAPARAHAPCAVWKFHKWTLAAPPSTLRARCRRPSATGTAAAAATAASLPFRRIGPAPSAPGCELPPHGTLEVGCFSSSTSVFLPPAADGRGCAGVWVMVIFFEPLRPPSVESRVQTRNQSRAARRRNR